MDTPGSAHVMILNWNGWEDTFACLLSLRACAPPVSVWLIDNGSQIDRTQEALALYPGLFILKLETNYGWAGGYNRALQKAVEQGFEYAYLLNNDCLIEPDFLNEALRIMEQDRRCAAVGSRVAYTDTEFTFFDGAYYEPGIKSFPPDMMTAETKSIEAVNGAGMLVRLEALIQDGFFDERFFCYHEEAEWCYRMKRSGWDVKIGMGSVIYHKAEGSNTNANTTYYKCRNYVLLSGKQAALDYGLAQISAKSSKSARDAVLQGLYDGFSGTFGQRGAARVPLMFRARVLIWLFSSRVSQTILKMRRAPTRLKREIARLRSA